MYEAAASCKDIARTPVTNWEPHGVTLAGYCYAVRHGMKVQLVTPYRRASHLQRYGVTVRGNVTSADPHLWVRYVRYISTGIARLRQTGYQLSSPEMRVK